MYQIYTDGATSKNGFEGAEGGYAWAILKDGECIDYASYYIAPATNNICEMMAIITACEEIKDKLESFDKVTLEDILKASEMIGDHSIYCGASVTGKDFDLEGMLKG